MSEGQVLESTIKDLVMLTISLARSRSSELFFGDGDELVFLLSFLLLMLLVVRLEFPAGPKLKVRPRPLLQVEDGGGFG